MDRAAARAGKCQFLYYGHYKQSVSYLTYIACLPPHRIPHRMRPPPPLLLLLIRIPQLQTARRTASRAPDLLTYADVC